MNIDFSKGDGLVPAIIQTRLKKQRSFREVKTVYGQKVKRVGTS